MEVKEGLAALLEKSGYEVKTEEDPGADLFAQKKDKYRYFLKIVQYGLEEMRQGMEAVEKRRQQMEQSGQFVLVYPCTVCGKTPEPPCEKCAGITGGGGCRLVTREEARLIEQIEDKGINIWGFDTIKGMVFLLGGSYPKDPSFIRELNRGGAVAKPHISLIRR
ncbi:MAG: hypothetical protein HYY20_09595 [Candidatus Tectomicrobia bacterium]|uniref:Uncharacterized protein n=1 Tax=Tectimicrobiota bacterium TaxID=2528274 RepID=A0A932CPF4_UNCTE|nr:hypothetical protein [Candidatus Tectomicrobia bacterium]